ncbi:MAG: MBL fold metallo-hydrolase [Burkholderiaceae bacterium]
MSISSKPARPPLFIVPRRVLGIALLLAGSLGGAAAPPAAESAPLRAQPVAPNVWMVEGEAALGTPANRNFISNAGFVVTDDGVVVIDALGSPALGRELIAEIRRVTSQPIRWVVVTHFHADHIYGLQAFKAIGASVIAHPAGRAYLQSETARQRLEASRTTLAPWIDSATTLVGADRWVDAPETVLQVGSTELRLVHVGPAHTPEDLVVWLPKEHIVFGGDLVFRGRIPYVGQADSRGWIASLDRLLGWQPEIVVPGHGALSRMPRADLELTRDYLLHLRRTMGTAARELEPFDDAYARADWSRYEALPLFRAANRMNAYNTYLWMEQEPR